MHGRQWLTFLYSQVISEFLERCQMILFVKFSITNVPLIDGNEVLLNLWNFPHPLRYRPVIIAQEVNDSMTQTAYEYIQRARVLGTDVYARLNKARWVDWWRSEEVRGLELTDLSTIPTISVYTWFAAPLPTSTNSIAHQYGYLPLHYHVLSLPITICGLPPSLMLTAPLSSKLCPVNRWINISNTTIFHYKQWRQTVSWQTFFFWIELGL